MQINYPTINGHKIYLNALPTILDKIENKYISS